MKFRNQAVTRRELPMLEGRKIAVVLPAYNAGKTLERPRAVQRGEQLASPGAEVQQATGRACLRETPHDELLDRRRGCAAGKLGGPAPGLTQIHALPRLPTLP